VLIHSQWADQHWQAIYVPPEIRQWVKLRNLCQVEDTLYVAPQTVGLPEIGAVVALDNDLLGAIRKVKTYCEQISGYSIDLNLERITEAVDTIQRAKELGIPFSDDPLPTKTAIAHALAN
jgi:hypothetical protein